MEAALVVVAAIMVDDVAAFGPATAVVDVVELDVVARPGHPLVGAGMMSPAWPP